jgi:hypothetical protein
MKASLFTSVAIIVLGTLFASSVVADDTLVRFKGGIGVIPISNILVDTTGAITVNRNIVRGINSPGQIWTINNLNAKIKTNGDIIVDGKGLVLAGGNSAGRTTGQSVFATLICEAATPFTEHSTNFTGVPLAPNGDFKIDDVLTPIPTDCASPMLLIRTTNVNPANRNWFAAGIPTSNSKGDD